jgi:hypothetical protein
VISAHSNGGLSDLSDLSGLTDLTAHFFNANRQGAEYAKIIKNQGGTLIFKIVIPAKTGRIRLSPPPSSRPQLGGRGILTRFAPIPAGFLLSRE